jgi:hypothetical protein
MISKLYFMLILSGVKGLIKTIAPYPIKKILLLSRWVLICFFRQYQRIRIDLAQYRCIYSKIYCVLPTIIMILPFHFLTIKLKYKQIHSYNRLILFHYLSRGSTFILFLFHRKPWGRRAQFHWKSRGVYHNS